jgi:hypothetical protein
MPKTVTNELIYEVLKNIQERLGTLSDDMGGVKTRLTSIDTRLGLVHMAHFVGSHGRTRKPHAAR